MRISLHEYQTPQAYVQALIQVIATTLGRAIEQDGRAALAVSGGRSPIPVFDALSKVDLPWEAVHIMLVDERFVPPDHPDSNERLVRDHLLRNKAAAARFTGLVSQANDIQASVRQANTLDDRITLALLGMGDDGHTASLFPGAKQLAAGLAPDANQRYLHVTPPQAPHERISMTLATLLSSERLILAISGQDKRHVLNCAAQGTNAELPISYVLNQSGVLLDVYWHP